MSTKKVTHRFERSSISLTREEAERAKASPGGIIGFFLVLFILLTAPFFLIRNLFKEDKGLLDGDFPFKLEFEEPQNSDLPEALVKVDIDPTSLRSDPPISGLNDLLVNMNLAEVASGLYFLSYDPNEPKQYLWFIATGTAELEQLTELNGYDWDVSEVEGVVQLDRVVGQKLEMIKVLTV